MIRKEYVLAAVLTLAGAAAGYWLLPEDADVARMEVRDFNYTDPKQHYEAQFESGDHSVDVVQQLVRIHTNIGNVDRAIEVLEVYVKEHPEDEKALRQLGQLYQFAQRNEEYMAILEARAKENETPIVLQEMAQLYNFFQEQEKQKETLARLELLEKGDNPKTLHELALFAAIDKEYNDVAKWLSALFEKHPNDYKQEDAIRHANALLELNKPEAALVLTQKWDALPQSTHADIATLIDMLHYQGGVEFARRMLNNYPQSDIEKSPELLHAWVLVLLDEGKHDEAYTAMKTLYAQDRLPEILMPDLMYIMAIQGNVDQFNELHKRTGLTRLTEEQLADIWVVAAIAHQYPILKTIRAHVAENETNAYPVLSTLIDVHDRESTRHAKVQELLESDLSNLFLLKLALATADAGDRSYANKFLAKLPDIEQLGDTELAELERVYLALNDLKAAKTFVARLKEDDLIESQKTIGLRTAAAIGDAEMLRTWHSENGADASPLLIDDLFYQAANHRHLRLALEISRWQQDINYADNYRRSIASIYTRLGRYSDALNLVEKEPVRTERDAKERLFLLSKLAPRSQQHRLRLQGLAKQWFRPSTSADLKEQLVFALLASGDETLAIPYMKQMADEFGGEWLLTYADLLEENGELDAATEYRLKAANDDSFDAQTKLGIAYALADRGHPKEAQHLLIALADQEETRIPATEQLVYMWGVRPDEPKLNWLTERWMNAEGEDKASYAKLLSGRIPPDQIVPYVKRHPELRQIPQVNQEYLFALADQHLLSEEIAIASERAIQTKDVRELQQLGRMARETGSLTESRKAYDAAYAIDPNNLNTLMAATITADGQGDYGAVEGFFGRYLAVTEGQSPRPIPKGVNGYEANFAYAELLRRNDRKEEALVYYERVFDEVKTKRIENPRALSLAAQSTAWLQDRKATDMLFDYAYERHPSDAVLRGDKAALLIDMKEYDAAKQELVAMRQTANNASPENLSVFLVSAEDAGTKTKPEIFDNGRQLLVHTAPESVKTRHWLANVKEDASVSYVAEGYDSVLVVTKLGYSFTVTEPNNSWMVKTKRAPTLDLRSEPAQLALREELLKARIDLETGNMYEATDRLENLESTYASDPQYLGFAANTYYYVDSWTAAQRKIDDAQAISPDNADIAKLKKDIGREHADRVRVDVTHITRGDNTELVTAISGQKQVGEKWNIGAVARHHEVDIDSRLQPDGTLRGESGDRQTAHLYGIYTHNAKQHSTLHLFANNETVGFGADHSILNPLGITELGVRWQEPYFEFVEGIFDSTVRDRVYVRHTVKPKPDWLGMLGVSYNSYDIETEDEVFTSFGVEANVVHAIQQSGPYIGLGYGLDAEYQIDNNFQQTIGGQLYRRLPLRSREIHFGSVTVAEEFNDRTYGSLLAGYGWDRLGGHGPSVEGRINHNIYGDWDVGARAMYGIDAANTSGDDLSLLNAYLQYRF